MVTKIFLNLPCSMNLLTKSGTTVLEIVTFSFCHEPHIISEVPFNYRLL